MSASLADLLLLVTVGGCRATNCHGKRPGLTRTVSPRFSVGQLVRDYGAKQDLTAWGMSARIVYVRAYTFREAKMTDLNATEARKKFFGLIKDAIEKHKVYHIHHRHGGVVLMSEEEYEALQETLELLSIPGFRESIARSVKQMRAGETYSVYEALGADG